jgi:sugar O-acyltransferase (sialic acid O-acetyltransferase NeuD family)
MQDLIIIGAGGTAQQIAEAVEDINAHGPIWNVIGMLDDDPAKAGSTIDKLRVLGPVGSAKEYDAHFIIGAANARDPGRRRSMLAKTGLPPERFATILHPSAYISRRATVGVGTAILQHVVITQNTVVGDHVIILQSVSIGHDVKISDFVTISPNATVTGLSQLCAGVYIGAHSAINNGRIVNENAVVGLGSVVVKDVPAGMVVVGNPARPTVRSESRLRS